MLIRELTGFYAGQVREFPSHIGMELIAKGRGLNPFNEGAPVQPRLQQPAPTAQASTVAAPRTTARKRR